VPRVPRSASVHASAAPAHRQESRRRTVPSANVRRSSPPRCTFPIMDSTGWLILGTFTGPVLGALAATGLIAALLSVAKARAQRVKYVPVSGIDLYANGVPLTESQFRELFAALQADLSALPPPGERSKDDMERQYTAVRRFSVLTGTFPQAFPSLGNVDQAWEWYASYNRYGTDVGPVEPWTLRSAWGDKG